MRTNFITLTKAPLDSSMKFGKYLASRQLELPEYSGHFIDYKALKKLIKHLAFPSTQGPIGPDQQPNQLLLTAEIQKRLKENKASFFFRVERELDKVNSFYLEKQANLAVNLDLLILKKNGLFKKSHEIIKLSNGSDSSALNFRNSISYLNLYQNFKKIHQDLIRLQQYIELNETGFSKVVKKWDKRSKSHTKELFILTAVSVQPVFHKNEINELSDLVTISLFDLESIMDGEYACLRNYTGHSSSASPSIGFQGVERHSLIGSIQTKDTLLKHGEIDELYLSFVNVATLKDLDLGLLVRWVDKVKLARLSGSNSPESVSLKLSKIFLLSLTNLKISDTFLESFLNLIDYDIDFSFINDDFNNDKTILHECCSIESALSHATHTIINNGVKVVNSTDSIEHSRTFIVEHIMKNLPAKERDQLLICEDFNGRNCLHYASQNNRLDMLDIILPDFPKSNIDSLDNDSMSPLVLAIKNGNLQIIKKFVEIGANCFPKFDDSKPQYLPVNYACKFGDYMILEYLLSRSTPENKALVNQQDVEGLLPLHVISRSGHYNLIKLLISHGAEVNKLDGLNKWTPIFFAALEGHVHTTQELVKFGAKLNLVDEDGYNVLYYCVVEGHIETLNELLRYYNMIVSEAEEIPTPSISNIIGDNDKMSILVNDDDSEDSGSIDKLGDNIPDLKLPPPILPLRRYGHNFLEQKVLIELTFPSENFINLFSLTADLKPGRITLTSNITDIVPRNVLLPVTDETKANNNCVFQTDVDSLYEFRIDFEIFPKFGTRLIAKTTALSLSQIDSLSPEVTSIKLPLFDLRLRNIGELRFNYQVIYPFAGNLLETSKFDTYWKSSTSFVKNSSKLKLNAAGGLSPNNFLSPSSISSAINGNGGSTPIGSSILGNTLNSTNELISGSTPSSVVTATSLSGEYLRIRICLLNDGTPIVCPHWSIAITENIELYLPNLSLDQLESITSNLFDYKKVMHDLSRLTVKDIELIKKLLKIIYLPLNLLLDILSVEINLNLELIFPSSYELESLPFIGNIQQNLNNYIDFALNDIFNHIRSVSKNSTTTGSRSIIFLSSNSLICKILNWKQPNFPVFLVMNGIAFNHKINKFESRTTNGLIFDEIKPMRHKKKNGDDMEIDSGEVIKQGTRQEITIRSIKEAVNFSINNNLIGVITSIHLLNLVPKLIPLIRSRGLILVASYDITDDESDEAVQRELDAYARTEINGLRFDEVLSFKGDISM